jgi:hypothetical protein
MAKEAADSDTTQQIQAVTSLAARQVRLGRPAMKVRRGFVDPIRAGKRMIVVTIVTTGRIIAKAAVQVMTRGADSVRSCQAEFFMGNGAVLPIHSIWDLAA